MSVAATSATICGFHSRECCERRQGSPRPTVAATVARCETTDFNAVNYDSVYVTAASRHNVAAAFDDFREYRRDQRRSPRLSLRLSGQQLQLSIRTFTVTWPSDVTVANVNSVQSRSSVAATYYRIRDYCCNSRCDYHRVQYMWTNLTVKAEVEITVFLCESWKSYIPTAKMHFCGY